MSSIFLREAPFVRLVFPVILGIIAYNQWPLWNSYTTTVLAMLCIVLWVFAFRVSTAVKHQYQPLIGITITLILIGFGAGLNHYHQDRNRPRYVKEQTDQQLCVKLIDDPILKGNYYKSKAKVVSQQTKQSKGTIMLYLELSETLPAYGDLLMLHCDVSQVPPPKNPFEFDYQRFLFHQNIDFQAFIRRKNWQCIDRNTGNSLFQTSFQLKHHIQQELEKHLSSDSHIAILKALLLGDKSGIEGDLKTGFMQTGTMHVMAVSGLHVGIVYAFMNGLMMLTFRKRWKYLGIAISLSALWFFALITGFSPSVNRACFMFSILAIGGQIGRRVSVYNSIACAAFFLLIVEPSSLFNVGFQFSFLAVVGIVSLQKPLRRLIQTKYWFMGKLLDLTAVSVAAQLATLPLALYYFGQFPVLFFLSNLFVIPAITVILYIGLCFVLVSKITVLAGILAWLLKVYLWFVLEAVQVFQSIPNSFIQHISITAGETVILTLIVLCLSMVLTGVVTKKALKCALIGCTVLFGYQTITMHNNRSTVEIIMFDLNRQTCIVLRAGTEVINLTSDEIQDKDWEYRCVPYLASRGVTDLKKPIRQQTISQINIGGRKWQYNQLQNELHNMSVMNSKQGKSASHFAVIQLNT